MARTLLGRRQLEAAQRGQQGADKLAHLQQQGERIHEDDEVRESVEDVTQQKGEVAIQAALQAEVKEQTQVPKPSNATTMQPERCESTKSDEAAHMALKKLADKERLRRAQEDAIRRQSDRMQKRIKVNDEKRTKIEEQEAKRMKLTLRNAVGMDHTAQTAVAMAPEKKTQTTTTTTTTRKTWKILEQVTPAGLQRNQAATTIPAKKPARKSSRISKRRQTKSVARPSEHAGFGGKSPRSIEPTNFHALDEAGKKAYRMALLRGKISDQQAREDLMKREVIWVATRHASPEVLGKGLELFRKAHEKDIPRAVKRGMKVAHLLLSYFHVLQELENGHVGAATSEGSGRTQVKAGLPATSDEPSQLSATSTIGAGGISNSSLVAAQPAKTPRKTAPARSSKRNGPTEPALVFLPPSSTPTSQPLPDPAPAQNLVFVQVRSDEAKMGLVAGTNSMGRPKRRSAVAADQARREHNTIAIPAASPEKRKRKPTVGSDDSATGTATPRTRPKGLRKSLVVKLQVGTTNLQTLPAPLDSNGKRATRHHDSPVDSQPKTLKRVNQQEDALVAPSEPSKREKLAPAQARDRPATPAPASAVSDGDVDMLDPDPDAMSDDGNTDWTTDISSAAPPATPSPRRASIEFTWPRLPALKPKEPAHFQKGLLIALENIAEDQARNPGRKLIKIVADLEDNRPTFHGDDKVTKNIVRGGTFAYECVRGCWAAVKGARQYPMTAAEVCLAVGEWARLEFVRSEWEWPPEGVE